MPCVVLFFVSHRRHAGRQEMEHNVEYIPSAHHLRPEHGQQGSQAEREKDSVGSNLTGYQRESKGQQARLQAL